MELYPCFSREKQGFFSAVRLQNTFFSDSNTNQRNAVKTEEVTEALVHSAQGLFLFTGFFLDFCVFCGQKIA